MWISGNESTYSAGDCLQLRRLGFDPWVGKIPWGRKWQPTPVFCGKSHGQRSLGGYSLWGRKSRTRLSNHTTTLILSGNLSNLTTQAASALYHCICLHLILATCNFHANSTATLQEYEVG